MNGNHSPSMLTELDSFIRKNNLKIVDGKAKQVLKLREKATYYVLDGEMELRVIYENGEMNIVDLIFPGETIEAIEDNDTTCFEVFTTTETKLLEIGEKEILNNPEIILFLNNLFRKKLSRLVMLKAIQQQYRVEDRVLGLFNWYANQFGTKTNNGILINIRITHQQIALFVGSTRPTITRIINKMSRLNILKRVNVNEQERYLLLL
ncbi:Crp/Fnr family transcriptional regulator [Bacillus sp. JJ1562]|uniref:Crp/Fnr family transcriptional regulator n=1 Tax=Bacillus sp. JJ1562 TaxID=3122960 RepID=UPI0030022128